MPLSRLPLHDALKTFEAAGLHFSFTRVAGELGPTRAAISHQVGKLKECAGARHVDRRCPVVCSSRDTCGTVLEDCPAFPSPRGNEQPEPVHPAGERGESRTPGPVRVTAVVITNGLLEEHGKSPWYGRFGTMPCSGFQPEVCRRHMTSDD